MWYNSYTTPTECWQETSDFPKGCAKKEDSEHCLNELQRLVWAAAISAYIRDGHETLTLLLQPPRILCASTGHYLHHPSQEPVQPATARVLWYRDNFLKRTHRAPQAVATSLLASAATGSPCILYASHPPAWVSQSPLISWSFNPLLPGRRTDARGWPTFRGGAKSKAESQELCEQRRERETPPSSLRSSGLNLHNQLDVPCICGTPE